jgi:hypothetical protein
MDQVSGEPNGYDLCTTIAELNHLIRCLPGLGEYYKRAHIRKLFQSLERLGGKRSPVEGVAADPNYRFRVTVRGPIPTIHRVHLPCF